MESRSTLLSVVIANLVNMALAFKFWESFMNGSSLTRVNFSGSMAQQERGSQR